MHLGILDEESGCLVQAHDSYIFIDHYDPSVKTMKHELQIRQLLVKLGYDMDDVWSATYTYDRGRDFFELWFK